MKKGWVIVLGISISLYGGTIKKGFHFSESEIKIEKIEGYDYISMEGCLNLNQAGKPSLPYKDVYFLIPPSAEITNVKIISKDEEVLSGEYNIYPAQKYFPLSHPEIFKFTPPDEKTYLSINPYPENYYTLFPSGSKSGFRIQGIRIYPLRYIPKDKKLILVKKIDIELTYQEGKNEVISLTETQFKEFSRDVQDLVTNPEDLLRFSPPVKTLRQNEVNYAIITSDQFTSYFNPLKEWRTKQGWKAEIFTTSWIYSNYTGYDNQEKIRNFIKDYFQNHGLVYVLLGGDANIIPVREAYLPYYGDSYIATDLYYADLDGTWDADGDHRYGEMNVDGVDVYADVYVGRFVARTTTHIQNMINKVFTYEKNPPAGYQKRVELPSVQLFSWWHGREVNNAIGDSLMAGSSGWTLIKLEDPSRYATRDTMSHGVNFCHGAAHGDPDGWYYQNGSAIYLRSDIGGLTNGTKYCIVNAIACYSGNFDETVCCFAESLITKYPSGAVATIMNTRYGWGSYSGFGPSELLDIKFYSHFAKRDMFIIGKAHFEAKNTYRNNMLSDTVWAYCGYELTLFGDPAMPMWERSPLQMTVDHPSVIPMTTYDVQVTVYSNNNPLPNALVCLYKPNEVHVKGYTNSSGQVTLTVSPTSLGDMYITVTAKDHLPYEGTIQVVAAGMPDVPTVIKPFNFAKLPDKRPVLSFYSYDPQGDQIEYMVLLDNDPNFTSPETLLTPLYPSGQVVNFILPNDLIHGNTYWWKVRCRDPQGSGYWTQFTQKRSFTVDTLLAQNTCSWYQKTAAQWSYNTFNGTMIQGDSIVLIPQGQVVVDTLLFENFESGIPSNWTVIDGNNDGYKWTAGTTPDLSGYEPPNYGTKYAYYSDDDAGNGVINTYEAIISPSIYVPSNAQNLKIQYGYGFRVYQTGETYEFGVRFFKNGSWGSWINLKTYTSSGSGTETIDLSSNLPADSVQFRWYYHDESSSSHWGWATGLDNVLVFYSYTLSNNFGTMTTVPILYSDLSKTYPRTNWGYILFYKSTADDSVGIQVEYYDGANWQLVPDNILPGNSQGIFSNLQIGSVDISNLDTLTYKTLRVIVLFYRVTQRTPDNPSLCALEVGRMYVGAEEVAGGAFLPYLKAQNIFRDALLIHYAIPKKVGAELKIYDMQGRLIRDLSGLLRAGENKILWKDKVGSGVYFVKFKAGGYKKTLKVVKIK